MFKLRHARSVHRVSALVVLCLAAWNTAGLRGSESAPDAAAPVYEPITLSTCYEVEPNWPKRPDDCHWDQTPGVAVDDKDQVFMRFNTSGKLLQLWTVPKAIDGQEQPGQLNWLHAMAVDSSGNIYATDITGQRTQKFVRLDY